MKKINYKPELPCAWYTVAVVFRKTSGVEQTECLITVMIVEKSDKGAIIEAIKSDNCAELIYQGYKLTTKSACRTDFEVKEQDKF